ncbi:hypothetical protein GIB67_037397 [Kingdonia uniflora]|uniref:Peptidyl-prolyl cis-trans isomerase n=1 Tax=Kingdonia uniflora TaxID=39325 RepID=A0A7J7M8I4_9MAGN|nr:hypothetical protein GIB67_037397 [Kingdonia uniflora]
MANVFFDMTVDGSPVGRIVMELFDDVTPLTARNFRALCTGEKGIGLSGKPLHYKGSSFCKVIPGIMCMGGDITTGDGSSGESIYGVNFPNENYFVKHNQPGRLSMVNGSPKAPNTSGSQFFICKTVMEWLDGALVGFGQVIKGMDVLEKIEKVGSYSGTTSKSVIVADCGVIS